MKKITSITLFSPVTFLLAFFGFFLTFTDVNCNGQKLDSISGLQLATGYQPHFDIDKENTTPAETERYDPNIFALNALLASLIGLVIYIVKPWRKSYALTAVVAAIGFICMLGLMIDLKTKLANAQNSGSGEFHINLDIQFEMKFGYWFVTFCFLVALIWNYLKSREAMQINDLLPEEDRGEISVPHPD